MQKKNRVFLGKNGNEIELRIIATSPEKANILYSVFEKLFIECFRSNLERDFKNDNQPE